MAAPPEPEDQGASLASLLASARSRGEIKRAGERLDRDRELRAALLARLRAHGLVTGDEADAWPGKRLLRRALAREEVARERRNPIARDEAFDCLHCGRSVAPHGRTARDHCPHCLRSRHVDEVPGDRAATCGGLLDPIGVEQRGGRYAIAYRCRACGAERINQALLDGEEPDDWEQLVALASRAGGAP